MMGVNTTLCQLASSLFCFHLPLPPLLTFSPSRFRFPNQDTVFNVVVGQAGNRRQSQIPSASGAGSWGGGGGGGTFVWPGAINETNPFSTDCVVALDLLGLTNAAFPLPPSIQRPATPRGRRRRRIFVPDQSFWLSWSSPGVGQSRLRKRCVRVAGRQSTQSPCAFSHCIFPFRMGWRQQWRRRSASPILLLWRRPGRRLESKHWQATLAIPLFSDLIGLFSSPSLLLFFQSSGFVSWVGARQMAGKGRPDYFLGGGKLKAHHV